MMLSISFYPIEHSVKLSNLPPHNSYLTFQYKLLSENVKPY